MSIPSWNDKSVYIVFFIIMQPKLVETGYVGLFETRPFQFYT